MKQLLLVPLGHWSKRDKLAPSFCLIVAAQPAPMYEPPDTNVSGLLIRYVPAGKKHACVDPAAVMAACNAAVSSVEPSPFAPYAGSLTEMTCDPNLTYSESACACVSAPTSLAANVTAPLAGVLLLTLVTAPAFTIALVVSVPSVLCDTSRKVLRIMPHRPSSPPGVGSRAMNPVYIASACKYNNPLAL